jgi:hypothetical protein
MEPLWAPGQAREEAEPMLKMELVGGRYAPVVTCDWCGQRIARADRGN